VTAAEAHVTLSSGAADGSLQAMMGGVHSGKLSRRSGQRQPKVAGWRRRMIITADGMGGPLVMIVGGGSENETPIESDAEAMEARANALIP
jgi:hypothetical protein